MLVLMNLMEKEVNKSEAVFYLTLPFWWRFLFSGMGAGLFFGVFEDSIWAVFVGCLVLSKKCNFL